MSVICTVDRSEYWQQVIRGSQHRVIESFSTQMNTTSGITYIQNALSIDELALLIKTQKDVIIVVPPPYVLLCDFIEADHLEAVCEVQNQLDALYSLHKKHRNTITLVPLSSFCCNCSTDTSSLPWHEKIIDNSKVIVNIDSVICHSLFNQNSTMIKSYKRLQSCFSLREEESVLYPNIDLLKHALAINEVVNKELLDENERLIGQNLILLECVESKSAVQKELEHKLTHKLLLEQTLRAELAGLRIVKESKLWKVSRKLERLANVVDKQAAKSKKLSQDIILLYKSGLFDADWYLEKYPDVQKSSIDPAKHYLLYGASEGRKPSPSFDGDWYLQANPDVRNEKINPLIHYVKFGRDEKRPISPAMITYENK